MEKRERQRQKLVNETAEEKEIRLAKRREAYKKRSEERKEKRKEYLRSRQECREGRQRRLQGLR